MNNGKLSLLTRNAKCVDNIIKGYKVLNHLKKTQTQVAFLQDPSPE